MIALWKYHKIPLLFSVISSLFYVAFAYDLVRSDSTKLILLYAALFVFAFKIIKTTGFNFKLLVIFSIVFRLLFLFATPNLSQDFYRFIWDGQIILSGFNPYLSTPNYQMEMGVITGFNNQVELFNGMGSLSASHFTNYPPINQLCFVIANLFPGQSILSSVIGLRLIIIAADIGTLYFGKKLLEQLKIPSSNIFWYILNPFIIIELTGNLHFEGVMIFFLIWSLYLLQSGKWKWAAVVLACSISVKLIPLMLLPLFFNHFKTSHKQSKSITFLDTIKNLNLPQLVAFYTIVITTIILLFIPFFSMEFVTNYTKTIGLWFGNFEFNASFYYLARAIGYAITGYNEIAIIGKILPIVSILIILGFTFFKDNSSLPKLITSMLLVLTLYLFLGTTIHPWYIATLVILSVFTNYKFPLVWSLVVVLSYQAYAHDIFKENLWIVALEYIIVFAVFIWEVLIKKRLPVP
ncbi:mannosyltransferase [Winogradskyella litoriviva]|uniref:Mannosyltransferase n=1 Tax=Winogradskyella litoriviva TaxID=1220182 RepID=A0ABX2DZR2_9FLAO|nr:mannosyltransferase [Winogradskyella litoriviva]NRD21762.1 mannosyltransferase [Winogradskyella litoriviva]